MRLRLPRPSRGWPEFLDDLMIVILGVFIALLAQEFLGALAEVLDHLGGALVVTGLIERPEREELVQFRAHLLLLPQRKVSILFFKI